MCFYNVEATLVSCLSHDLDVLDAGSFWRAWSHNAELFLPLEYTPVRG